MKDMTPLFDLEERTWKFSDDVRKMMRMLPSAISTSEDAKQLLASSGSVGANYIEANESLGKKDFIMRIKISLKEAKESRYWLRLLDVRSSKIATAECIRLQDEALQFIKIFSSIVIKVKNKPNES